MSTGYVWEGIRQIYVMLLGARHVPERLCGGFVYLGATIRIGVARGAEGVWAGGPSPLHVGSWRAVSLR